MQAGARLHPLRSAAAISVIVLAIAGVGALTGLLPRSGASFEAAPKPAEPPVPAAPVATPAAPAAPAAAPTSDPKPVKKAVVRTSAPAAPKKTVPVYEAKPVPSDEEIQQAERTPLPPPVVAPKCTNCGTVENVRVVEQKGEGSGIGAVAGGVAGTVVGKQFGKGSGQTIMTILGAAGGAYAGHEAEKHIRARKYWEVSVRLDDGSSRLLTFETEPAWRSGDRVRYVNGALEPEPV
jgi:outer membrane lipoprotein SlyB